MSAFLRIGIDARELLPGPFTGSGRYLANFLEADLTRTSGHHFVLYGHPDTQFPSPSECFTFKILRAPATLWWDHIALNRALKRDRIDLFFTPYDKMPYRAPCPVFITIHDILYQRISDHKGLKKRLYNALYRAQRGAMARRAAGILTVSEYSRRDIAAFYGLDPDRIAVTFNAVSARFNPHIPPADIARVKKKYGLNAPYILNLSNFKPHKNPETLIAAYANLSPDIRKRTHLVLAGAHNAFVPPLRAQAKTLHLSQTIHFPGAIAEADLPALYAGAALFAFPSLCEGFGLPPLEAMACGIPVVASNATSLPEVVGDAGLLVSPSDIHAFSAAIARLLSDNALHQTCAENGLQRAQLFSLETVAGRILNAIERVNVGTNERWNK